MAKRCRPWALLVAWSASLLSVAGVPSGCAAGGAAPARPDAGVSPEVGRALEALEKEPWTDPRRTVAEVNGKAITQGEFYRRLLEQFGTKRFLTGLVAQEILFQEAARRKLAATPEEVDRGVNESIEEEARQAGGRENLSRQYQELGLTLDEVGRERARMVESDILLTKVVKALRVINDEVLREYYKYTYANTRYATRHIAYSFRPKQGQTDADVPRLKLEAQSRAARAADSIRKGADFTSIARAESDDVMTASRGGELEPVFDDPKVPEYMRVVFKLGVNEVSEPVENPQGGYHVFQVTAILPSESFGDCQAKMRKEILEQVPSAEEKRLALRKLQSEANVRIFPAVFSGEDGAAPRPSASRAAEGK